MTKSAMFVEAITQTARDLLRALDELRGESEALLRELDEAWGSPVDAKDIVTVYPSDTARAPSRERFTMPA